jgi:BMFP domain-containing protein YqiC
MHLDEAFERIAELERRVADLEQRLGTSDQPEKAKEAAKTAPAKAQ